MREKILIQEKSKNIKFLNLSKDNFKYQSLVVIPMVFLTLFLIEILFYLKGSSTRLENWNLILGLMVICFAFGIIMIISYFLINYKELLKVQDKFRLSMGIVFSLILMFSMGAFCISGIKDLRNGTETIRGKYKISGLVGSFKSLYIGNSKRLLIPNELYYEIEKQNPNEIKVEYLDNTMNIVVSAEMVQY